MPYTLRRAPRTNLFWVVSDTGRHMSKDPMPYESAVRQMRALYAAMKRKGE